MCHSMNPVTENLFSGKIMLNVRALKRDHENQDAGRVSWNFNRRDSRFGVKNKFDFYRSLDSKSNYMVIVARGVMKVVKGVTVII